MKNALSLLETLDIEIKEKDKNFPEYMKFVHHPRQMTDCSEEGPTGIPRRIPGMILFMLFYYIQSLRINVIFVGDIPTAD